MSDLATRDDLSALADLGYQNPKFFAPDHWAAIIQAGSFVFVVDGNRTALAFGYQNRWEYSNMADAGRALHDWNGIGQPREYISAKLDRDITVWP